MSTNQDRAPFCPTCHMDVWSDIDMQEACGLAFDYGREIGNLQLRQILLDREMLRCADDLAREEIGRLRVENEILRQAINTAMSMGPTETTATIMENVFAGLRSGQISSEEALALLSKRPWIPSGD